MSIPRVVGQIAGAISPEITKAVLDFLVKSPSIPVTSVQAPEIKTDLEPVVDKIVERQVERRVEPYIRNANNQEGWYKSRIFWGGAIATVALLAGWNVTPEEVGYWTDLAISLAAPLASVAYMLYGRFVPNKPLG